MQNTIPNIVEINEVLVGVNETPWHVKSYLGKGCFGAIVLAVNKETGQEVALKLEDANQEVRTLRLEVEVLQKLAEINSTHCCAVFDRGRKGDRYNWVAMSLVGKSLMKLQMEAKKKFTLRTALHLANGTLEGISDLHRAGFLHRDIKPANFAIGLPPNCKQIYILDFGMARKYLKDDGRHRRARETTGFRGTPFYASPVALQGGEQGRRDDVWAWFFMIIEFTVEKLPWAKTIYRGATTRERLKDMAEDRQFYVENCDKLLIGCPKQFSLIHEHLNKLQFSDAPDYEAIIKAIQDVYSDQNIDINSPLQYENQIQTN
ncbi:putative serine/threonine-protein kinase [Trichinella patagoniensis]|uniref:Putative serine/threonine-protein kinase n=1 Tax=Trichinella patagoniensis TaxID=990121 RepID=A0A0V1A2P2_9BILA|nr:putative serine/threonine-protein kinase [Trichinella patagoniensis]